MPRRSDDPTVVAELARRVEAAGDRRERLAFNLWDLELVHPDVRARLLPMFDLRKDAIAWVDPDKIEETAAPFRCRLLDAAVACDLVRGMARHCGEAPPRVYVDRAGQGNWERVPGDADLTIRHDGITILDPVLFPRSNNLQYQPPPKRRRASC